MNEDLGGSECGTITQWMWKCYTVNEVVLHSECGSVTQWMWYTVNAVVLHSECGSVTQWMPQNCKYASWEKVVQVFSLAIGAAFHLFNIFSPIWNVLTVRKLASEMRDLMESYHPLADWMLVGKIFWFQPDMNVVPHCRNCLRWILQIDTWWQ